MDDPATKEFLAWLESLVRRAIRDDRVITVREASLDFRAFRESGVRKV
jgi:hypothetical protein